MTFSCRQLQFDYPATHAGLIWYQTTVIGYLREGRAKLASLTSSEMRLRQDGNPYFRYDRERTL